MSLRKLALGIVFALLFVAAFMLMTDNASATSSGPITIDGNAAMTQYANAHSLQGDGTYLNPYVIDGLTINAHQAENGIVIKNVDQYVTIQNCAVNNTHYFNSIIGSGDGIFVSSCPHMFIWHNQVNGTWDGITALDSQSVVIYQNTVSNVTKAGIKVADVAMSSIYRNFCADSNSGITSLMGTQASRFDNNTCLRGTYGLYFSGSNQNIVSDNIARGYLYGIYVDAGSMWNQIDLNNCSFNSVTGIVVMDHGNTVSANKVCSNTFYGIYLNSVDNSVVKNNLCLNNPYGIYASAGNHVTLNGNNCSGSSQYGFSANSAENLTTSDNVFYSDNIGVYLNNCKNSYLWYDEVGLSTQYGFLISHSNWIYTTATCSHNGVSGFRVDHSNNCTVGSANASHNGQYGVWFESCHGCRVIDGSFMANGQYGIYSLNSDNSSIQRVRAFLNQQGVELYGSAHESISDCHLLGNSYGIWIYNSDWTQVTDNEMADGSSSGMYLFGTTGSDNCTISGNSVTGFTHDGIQISSSKWTIVRDNTISENDNGIKLNGASHITIVANDFEGDHYGVYLISSSLCMVMDNDFNDESVYGIYATGCANDYFESNAFEDGSNDICLQSSDGCLVTDNQCDASGKGISILSSTGTTISSGRCKDSTGGAGSIGIYVHLGSGTYIQNVNLTQCKVGLKIENSTSDVVTGNIFLSNRDVGVSLLNCTNVLLHDNLFLYNHGSTDTFSIIHNQAYDNNQTNSNHWNTAGPDGIGNFWSDWCWPDIDRDGIVDSSFFIIGGGSDYFPIADPTPPVVAITSPNHDGVIFTSSSVSLSWDATDTWSGFDHFEIIMDSGPWQNVGYGNIQTFGLTEGQHHLRVKAVDKAGNEANTTRMFYVDLNAPIVSITAPGNHTAINDNTPTFEWTGHDVGSGTASYSVALDQSSYTSIGTTASYTFPGPLTDGPHTFNLMATDISGHVSIYSINLYVDTVVPTVDSFYPLSGSTIIVQDIPSTWYVVDHGSSSGLNRTEISIDSGDWVNRGLATDYTFLGVPEGMHTIHLRTFDNAGNMAQGSASFMVDCLLPTVSILSPSNHTSYPSNSVTITWSGSDTGSGIDHYLVSVDNAMGSDVGTATSWTAFNLGEGDHYLYVMAVDVSGKVRTAFINLMIDTEAPMFSISTPTAGGHYSSPNVNVTWTSLEYRSGVESYEVKVDGGVWQSTGFVKYAQLTLAEGPHVIMVRATDLVGNSRSNSVSIALDLNPPIIHSLTPVNGCLVNKTIVVFGWDASDTIGITYEMYSIDSDMGHGLMTGTTSTAVTLTPGSHSFKLTVRDGDGREAVGYVNLTVDTVAPTVVAHTPSSSNAAATDTITFRFSETVNVTGLSVKLNGQDSIFVRYGNSCNVTKVLVPGTTYTVVIAGAKDLAGNGMEAFSWNFNVVSGDASPGRIVISGTMVDKNGQAVSGASVNIAGQSTTTNDQGKFSLYVDMGQQQLHVTASGMTEYTQSVNADSDRDLGEMTMTSLADGDHNTPSSAGGDMTLFLAIGALVAVGAVAAVVMLRKRKG